MWRMFQQGTTVDLTETFVNPRLGQAVSAAVTEPSDIKDCLADGGRSDKTYEGTTPDEIVTHTPDWYGTREPVAIPRKVPVPDALHEYPGSEGAPVLQDVLQDGSGAVTLVTSEAWDLLEYRAWPYGGRVPNDRLPDIDEVPYSVIGEHWGIDVPVRREPGVPQRSLLSQWKSVPTDGVLEQPSMVFLYEMFDWTDSADFKPPWENSSNLAGWFPDKQQVMRRNYYDWGIYAFQIRRVGEPGGSNTKNALLHLRLDTQSNPCPDDGGPASNICGFRVNIPENVPLGMPPDSQGFGGSKVPSVWEAWGKFDFAGVIFPPWLRPAENWFYNQVADYGIYAADALLLWMARDPTRYRVESPEVHPSFTARWLEGDDDIELSIGQMDGALSNGWVDVRFWPHSGTLSSQTLDHKWYSLGRVQGETLSLVDDYGGVLRCWQYRSDNFENVEDDCGEDDDAEFQRTTSLMPFDNAEYEVFRGWRDWNFQIRVMEELLEDGRRVGFAASSPSFPVLVRVGDPDKQELKEEDVLEVITPEDRPHSVYQCYSETTGLANQLVDQYGNKPPIDIKIKIDCKTLLEFQSYIEVDLDHPGAASSDRGALDPDTPAWRYLKKLGREALSLIGGAGGSGAVGAGTGGSGGGAASGVPVEVVAVTYSPPSGCDAAAQMPVFDPDPKGITFVKDGVYRFVAVGDDCVFDVIVSSSNTLVLGVSESVTSPVCDDVGGVWDAVSGVDNNVKRFHLHICGEGEAVVNVHRESDNVLLVAYFITVVAGSSGVNSAYCWNGFPITPGTHLVNGVRMDNLGCPLSPHGLEQGKVNIVSLLNWGVIRRPGGEVGLMLRLLGREASDRTIVQVKRGVGGSYDELNFAGFSGLEMKQFFISGTDLDPSLVDGQEYCVRAWAETGGEVSSWSAEDCVVYDSGSAEDFSYSLNDSMGLHHRGTCNKDLVPDYDPCGTGGSGPIPGGG